MHLRAIATALLILSAPATFVFNYWWMPFVRLRDDEWYRTAPQCERLLVSRRALSSPLGPHHDAALYAGGMGDHAAVPHLIDSLRWQVNDDCGREHALDALRMLTGADAGDSRDAWAAWWEEHKDEPRWRAPRCS